MFLADADIHRLIEERQLIIRSNVRDLPFDPKKQIGAGSIDLRLNHVLKRFRQDVTTIDLSAAERMEEITLDPGLDFEIRPGEFLLGTTLETVIVPGNISGFISSRSSYARLGLIVVTQIYIQPGHGQAIALQLGNISDRPIRIRPYLAICQIMLSYTASPATVPYVSKADAKYRDEISAPQESKVGQELGAGQTEHLIDEPNSPQALRIAAVTKLREDIALAGLPASSGRTGQGLSGVLALVYLVLGSCVSVVISELNVRPFPSLKLLVSGAFIVFCVGILGVAYWRQ